MNFTLSHDRKVLFLVSLDVIIFRSVYERQTQDGDWTKGWDELNFWICNTIRIQHPKWGSKRYENVPEMTHFLRDNSTNEFWWNLGFKPLFWYISTRSLRLLDVWKRAYRSTLKGKGCDPTVSHLDGASYGFKTEKREMKVLVAYTQKCVFQQSVFYFWCRVTDLANLGSSNYNGVYAQTYNSAHRWYRISEKKA